MKKGLFALALGTFLCWFSYISPLLQMNGGFHAASISVLMILAGLGMVVGNQVSALLADRFKPGRFTCYPIVDMNDTCHFALFPMTEFDENQEIDPFLKFFPKRLCAYTKRHYLCTRKD